MSASPNFGPYQDWESIKSFTTVSESAHTSFDESIRANWAKLSRPVHHLFLRMAYQAKTTSLGIRLINSWALNLPALALLRVRLEQTIVSSYLLHEEEKIALAPFVQYIPIGEHRNLKAALEDKEVASQLLGNSEVVTVEAALAKTGAAATQVQAELTPGFALIDGKLQRNWTNLDLRSMAKRRDELAMPKGMLYRHSMEREYLSIYKTACSVVHADCSSLSYHYLDLLPSPSESPVLMAVPEWALTVCAALARYDVLQCFEILTWLEIPAEEEYQALMARWVEARDRYV